jgi:hypothetical protein
LDALTERIGKAEAVRDLGVELGEGGHGTAVRRLSIAEVLQWIVSKSGIGMGAKPK